MIFVVEASHIIDVVLDVSGICRRPPWVDRGGQVMWGILPEGLLASRNTRPWVVGSRGWRCIMGIPQHVDVKGILQGENKVQRIDDVFFINTVIMHKQKKQTKPQQQK